MPCIGNELQLLSVYRHGTVGDEGGYCAVSTGERSLLPFPTPRQAFAGLCSINNTLVRLLVYTPLL